MKMKREEGRKIYNIVGEKLRDFTNYHYQKYMYIEQPARAKTFCNGTEPVSYTHLFLCK